MNNVSRRVAADVREGKKGRKRKLELDTHRIMKRGDDIRPCEEDERALERAETVVEKKFVKYKSLHLRASQKYFRERNTAFLIFFIFLSLKISRN